MNKREDS